MTGATGSSKGQRSMGHIPIDGPGGSLAALSRHPGVRRLYTHLNNTNPVLDEASSQRVTVAAAGVEIAADGTEIEL
jgi:pyrroloquinoline quinone biosynthesis protein B